MRSLRLQQAGQSPRDSSGRITGSEASHFGVRCRALVHRPYCSRCWRAARLFREPPSSGSMLASCGGQESTELFPSGPVAFTQPRAQSHCQEAGGRGERVAGPRVPVAPCRPSPEGGWALRLTGASRGGPTCSGLMPPGALSRLLLFPFKAALGTVSLNPDTLPGPLAAASEST